MYRFLFYFLLFFIYSIIGWFTEMISVGIKSKKITNRGFLIGPYCPIYGFASITMILFLSKYKNDIIVLYLLGIIISSTLEYITSLFMEKIFKARWWDYSNRILNIDGRVCLVNSLFFGFLCVLLIKVINPIIVDYLLIIPSHIFIILTTILLIIFLTDFIISFNIIFKLKKSTENIKKDYTDEISEKVIEILMEQSKSFNRLLNAFPNFKTIYKTRIK